MVHTAARRSWALADIALASVGGSLPGRDDGGGPPAAIDEGPPADTAPADVGEGDPHCEGPADCADGRVGVEGRREHCLSRGEYGPDGLYIEERCCPAVAEGQRCIGLVPGRPATHLVMARSTARRRAPAEGKSA